MFVNTVQMTTGPLQAKIKEMLVRGNQWEDMVTSCQLGTDVTMAMADFRGCTLTPELFKPGEVTFPSGA